MTAVICINKNLIAATGDRTSATVLSQLRYMAKYKADDKGWFYYAQQKLMDKLCVSRSTIRRALRKLEDLDLIETERGPEKQLNLYRLKDEKTEQSTGQNEACHGSKMEHAFEPPLNRVKEILKNNIPPYNPPKGGKERKTKSVRVGLVKRVKVTTELKEQFNELWEAYPRKAGKQAALIAYVKARYGGKYTKDGVTLERDAATHEDIKAGVEAYVSLCQAKLDGKLWPDLQYMAHLSTYLNQSRWLDEQEQQPKQHKPSTFEDNPDEGGVFMGEDLWR